VPFDKLRQADCTFAEFEAACEEAAVIEEIELAAGIRNSSLRSPGHARSLSSLSSTLCAPRTES